MYGLYAKCTALVCSIDLDANTPQSTLETPLDLSHILAYGDLYKNFAFAVLLAILSSMFIINVICCTVVPQCCMVVAMVTET